MTTQNKRTAVYIDGYNLYYGRLRGTPYKWLDVVKLFEFLLREQDAHSTLVRVNVFTAHALATFATHGQDSVIAQQSYIRALQAIHADRIQFTLGNHSFDRDCTLLPTYIDGQSYDRTVRSRVWKLEEKQTDVNLALAMYRDAKQGLVDQQIICSNDSDAEPALKAIREDCPEIALGVVTPIRPPNGTTRHRSISASLSRHADWTRSHIHDLELEKTQLPDKVPTKKKPILKPKHW